MKNDILNYYNEFILEKKSYCEDKTIIFYEENLTRFINFIDSLDKAAYISYISMLRKSGIKNTSIRTYCRAVKAFSSWLVENQYIDSDFTKKVKLPRNDSDIIFPLTEYEVYLIDSSFDTGTFYGCRNMLIVHLMLDAGLRSSEVINLRFNDFDIENKVIIIRNSKYNKNRIIPMSEELINISMLYFNVYVCHSYNLIIKEDESSISSDTLKNLFRRLKKSTGIERLHPHLLRHTFATSYIMQGGNLEQLRIILGHSDYNVTRNYLHLAASNKLINYDIYRLDPNFL